MLHRATYPTPPPTVEFIGRPDPQPPQEGPTAFVVVAGRWDDDEPNTKLISAPLTLDAALVEYADCAGYPWRYIEYKGVRLTVEA